MDKKKPDFGSTYYFHCKLLTLDCVCMCVCSQRLKELLDPKTSYTKSYMATKKLNSQVNEAFPMLMF